MLWRRKEATAPTFQSIEDKALFEWLQDRGLPYQKVMPAKACGAAQLISCLTPSQGSGWLLQVSLSDCGEQGRGLVARERVKAGTPLLQVPQQLLLTPELCLQHCRLAPVLVDAELPAWSLLALYIVDVDTAAEADIQLPWSAYVSALPRLTGCVLEWTPDEASPSLSIDSLSIHCLTWSSLSASFTSMYQPFCVFSASSSSPNLASLLICKQRISKGPELLQLCALKLRRLISQLHISGHHAPARHQRGLRQKVHCPQRVRAVSLNCTDVALQVKALKGSPMAAAAQEILDAAERTYEQLQPLIKQAEDRGLIPPHSFTRSRIMWGLSMLLSRVARLPARESIEACIPWADFLNHAPDANCYLDWDQNSGVRLPHSLLDVHYLPA